MSVGYAPASVRQYHRHPLGLPAGSVRALLTFMILGTVWALLLIPAEKGKVPLYLGYLMFLVIGSYFGARGSAPKGKGVQESPPLYLPRGSIRFLIILGFAAVCGYGYWKDPSFFENFKYDPAEVAKQGYLPVVIFGSFFLGSVVTSMAEMVLAGEEGLPAWYQDIQAWIAVLAVLAFGAGIIYELIIWPTLKSAPIDRNTLDSLPWQMILSGIVAFYFGAR